jgi:choline dehydrogenase-like flavoprotein
MALWREERRFLVAFVEASVGLAEGNRAVAERAIDRLDAFLDAAPPAMRMSLHLALFLMPPGPLAKMRFRRKPLAWRREYLRKLFAKYDGKPPGFLLDRQGMLATIKSMVGGAYCETDDYWQRIQYSPVPERLPERRPGEPVIPPSGPDLDPSRPSPVGRFLRDRVTPVESLPERFDGEPTVVIIGSGAAGLAAAHALVSRPEGRAARIIILEAGKLYTNESFPRRTLEGFAQLYVDNGTTPNASQRIGFIQGKCVGGSSTVNNGGCIQPVHEWWRLMQDRWGAGGADLDWDGFAQAFDDLRDPLHVREVEPYVVTEGSRRAFRGLEQLDAHFARAGLLTANLKDCIACAQCNSGCRYDAHRAPFITLLPETLERSDRVHLVPDAPVTRLGFESAGRGQRVSYVEVSKPGLTRRIKADRVILAAGAYASSALLLRSGFISSDNRRRLVGQRFSCNFASPVLGRFRERMDGGRGMQIAYIAELPRERLIIETAFAPPTVLGMMMPQVGLAFDQKAAAFDHYGVCFPTLSSDAYGSIDYPGLPPSTTPQIRIQLEDSDWSRLVGGLSLCAEALRLAGAEEVFDSRYDGTTVTMTGDATRDRQNLSEYYRGTGAQTFFKVQSAHLQGGNVIHRDPRQGVVDGDCRVHGVDNLWIFDSSVFPAPITLNIQYATMALARYAALRMPLPAAS